MRSAAIAGGIFALAAGLLALALLRGTPLPFAAALIEARASEVLGRTVKLSAPPRVRIGTRIELQTTGVRIDNSEWAGPEPFASLEKAEVSVDFASLFRGPVLIEELHVDGLRINLATDAEGRSNVPSLAEGAPEEARRDGPSFLLREATVRNARMLRTNGATDRQVDLIVESLTQRETSEGRLGLEGVGSLQGRDWALSGQLSGLTSLLERKALSGRLEGSLGSLRLEGEYTLPDIERLDELLLKVELSGTVPPRIAALSPLLETTDPLLVRVHTTDIDPGIFLDATIDIGDFDVLLSGSIDDPGSGDGLDLSVDVDAGSLPRLARALNLGSTEEVPLTIDGRVRRTGRRLEIDEFLARAGEHRIEGTISLPLLPGTTDAQLDIHARGPDASFYQRLFKRPFEVRVPYGFEVVVSSAPDGRERVDARFDLASTTAEISGALSDFPSYAGSDLTIAVRGEDLSLLGRLTERNLPATGFSVDGAFTVSGDGRVSTEGLTASAAGADFTITGGIDTYPELDDIDAQASLSVPSLAKTGPALGLVGLGDVAASLELAISGAVSELALDGFRLTAGASEARSTSGALRVSPSAVRSDLRFEVVIDALSVLLGELAPAGMPSPRLTFALTPSIRPDGYHVAIGNFAGPRLSGSARASVGRQLRFDENARFTVDLAIEDPATLLPSTHAFTPTGAPLRLKANSRAGRDGREPHIDVTLTADAVELLRAELFPGSAEEPIRISLEGEGDRIRALGSSPYLPEGSQAYRFRGSASVVRDSIRVAIAELRIGDSELSGTGQLERADGGLSGTFDIARMDLPAWLNATKRAREGGEVAEASSPASKWLIPDTALSLALLKGPALDVSIETGPLGLPDPRHPTRSLIDRGRLRLLRNEERMTLEVRELEGSRGTLDLDFRAQRSGEGVAIDGKFNVARLPLGVIAVGGYDALPRHQVDASFNAHGSTPRELAAALDGELLLVGGRGTLQKTSTSLVTESFVEQLVLTLLPALKSQQPDMQVECSVLGARARQGTVTLDPGFVIRTERVDLSARGEVDLTRERLAIRFDNQARRGLGISAASLVNPYVQITGTLKKPTLGLDVAGSAIAGGAAVASGGLTVLAKPLFGRFLSRGNPCAEALERWRETGS